MSGVSPFATRPGWRANVSQIDAPRSSTAPSIWIAAVATPNTKPSGNLTVSALHRAGREPADEPPLRGEERNHHRHGRHDPGGHQLVVALLVVGDERADPERDRLGVVLRQARDEQQLVPREEERV